MLYKSSEHPFDEVEHLGVAIRFVGNVQEQVHIGLLYKVDQNVPCVLHFLENFRLENRQPPSTEFRWTQIELDELNKRNLVALCRLIAKNNPMIPYGFTYNGNYFSITGQFNHPGIGQGLTCATFVMAIFATYKIPLLLTDQWKSTPEDRKWQAKMIQSIKIPMLASAVSSTIGSPRFKPEHVCAGVQTSKRPLGFRQAEKLGERIIRDLKNSCAN